MSTELPENMGYGQVVGRFLRSVADGPDENRLPDGKAAAGKITFTAAPEWMTNITADPPVVIIPDPIPCTLDEEGYLIDPEGARGVWLPATDDEDLDPTGWTYEVLIALEGVPRRSFSIAVPEGTTRDLAKLTPVASSTGNAILRGPSAYEVAQAEGFVGSEAAWLASLVGPQGVGVADITTDTTVGTRVFIGDTLIYGDTGPRSIVDRLLPDTLTAAGAAAPRFIVQRTNNLVTVSIRLKVVNPTTALGVFRFIDNMPAGFQQTPTVFGVLGTTKSGNSTVTIENISGVATLTVRKLSATATPWDGSELTALFTYPTDQAWPTTLPGSPA